MSSPTKTACGCGCGAEVKPGNSYVHGHNNRHLIGGSGDSNVRWKGDDAGRSAIHKWLNKHWPLTGTCEQCGATDRRTGYSNVDHKWRRERDDYRELCDRCHRYYDYLELGTPNPRLDKVFAKGTR